jgi:hypothetical protein
MHKVDFQTLELSFGQRIWIISMVPLAQGLNNAGV